MNKSPDAFRTISEVAEDLDLPQHVLRFWETRFKEIKPLKRGGGRRYYRPDDVDLLRGIRHLLYAEGYTIRGLQRILKEHGNRFVIAAGRADASPATLAEFGDMKGIGSDQGGDEPEAEDDLPELPAPAAVALPAGPSPGQQAQTVSEIARSQKRAGLLDRFRTREFVEPVAQGGTLGPDERRRLQATLYELLECKRLLDQVRGN